MRYFSLIKDFGSLENPIDNPSHVRETNLWPYFILELIGDLTLLKFVKSLTDFLFFNPQFFLIFLASPNG